MTLKLVKICAGHYATRDYRYLVERHDDYETDCECMFCISGRDYLCPNDRISYYSRWIVWDEHADDYAKHPGSDPGPSGFDTMRDAREWLDRHRRDYD